MGHPQPVQERMKTWELEKLGFRMVRFKNPNLMVRHHALTPWRVALQCRTGWLEGRESQDHMKFLTFMKRKKLENREKF